MHSATYLYDRILYNTKKNELSSYKKTWRNMKCILLSERSQSEKATYYSNYMMFWEMPNYGDCKKISGSQGLGGRKQRGMNR